MTSISDVQVKVDERLRLMGALLAATNWPEAAQARKPHGAHAFARAAQKRLQPFRAHPAVQILQRFLDRGAPLESMFALMGLVSWPDLSPDDWPAWAPREWPDCMADFYRSAELASWWGQEDSTWQKALTEAATVLARAQLKPFLKPFLGDVSETLVFMPNIGQPSSEEVGLALGEEIVALVPPRLAWGDSPPWPYDEDPTYIYRAALFHFGRPLLKRYLHRHSVRAAEAARTPLPVSDAYRALYPEWQDQFIALFLSGLVAIYLEDYVSQAEARAYVLVERKVHGVAMLPSVVSVQRRYLSDYQEGRQSELAEVLPLFARRLRVAKGIVSL